MPATLPVGVYNCRRVVPLAIIVGHSRSCRRMHLSLQLTPSTPPVVDRGRRCRSAAYHGQPRPPAVTTVGGGGAWDRVHSGQSGGNPCRAFPDRPQGRDGAHFGGLHGPGAARLPLVSCVGGGAGTRPVAPHPRRRCRGRKVASHAIALLCPYQRLLHRVRSLWLPAQGLPQVTEILPNFFAARRSVRAVSRIYHISHLGGISPCDWQTKPCKWSARAAGTEHFSLACRGLEFLPADCAAWLLRNTADRPVNVFEASAGLFSLLTG